MHLKQHAKYKLVEKKKSISMMGFVDSSMGHQSNKTSAFSKSNFTENISLQRALLKKTFPAFQHPTDRGERCIYWRQNITF